MAPLPAGLPGVPAPSPTPPGGTGPAAVPSPMAGSAAQGTTLVRTALQALQQALPHVPMGSDLHMEVLKSISGLSKHLGGEGPDPSAVIQQLAQMAMRARTQPSPMGAAPPPAGGAQPPMIPHPGPSPMPMAA